MAPDAALQCAIPFLGIEIEARAIALEYAKAKFVHSLESGQIEVAAFRFQLAIFQS
jgi:hypothetical protein